MAERQSTEDKKANASYLRSRMRECHDCHKPTWNYRCTACDRKHKAKYGVLPSVSDAEA